MTETMTTEMKQLARHALGLDNPKANGRSYRNRYVAYSGNAVWDEMVRRGWAVLEVSTYCLRREGAELALEPGERLDPEDFPVAA